MNKFYFFKGINSTLFIRKLHSCFIKRKVSHYLQTYVFVINKILNLKNLYVSNHYAPLKNKARDMFTYY